nr:MAG TPA: hypothetical protein [Caudoviricetes sp.]
MASTTYEQHQLKMPFLVGVISHFDNNSVFYSYLAAIGKMYAVQEQFRHLTKMVCVCLRGLTKTYHFAVIGKMVRNAGQLPQPFWLGAACGGGSHSLSASVARA